MAMRNTASYDMWTLDAANEYTPMMFSKDYRNIVFTAIAASSAACTFKIYTSNQEARPDLNAAASATNQYSTTEVVYLMDWSAIDWDTWVVYSGSSDWIHKYEININNANRVGIKMTARAAWSVALSVVMTDNW